MQTVEGTTGPLETGADKSPVPRPRDRPDEPPMTPLGKLAEADRHLLAIGAEVATLREELARLREEAGERAQLLIERDAVIAELSGLLPTLEQARVDGVREAESAQDALIRSEARLSAQAGRVAELERRLATLDATTAAHERVVAEFETRLAEERSQREGAERALGEAHARTESVERALAEARARLETLSGDHERLLVERMEERGQPQRQAEEATAARASASRLSRETERAEALAPEQKALEAALSQRVAGLSALESKPARAQSEHEDAKAVARDAPSIAPASSGSTHLRFVARAGRYTLSECDGAPPEVGQVIEVGEERFVVSKTGPSPLPSDPRSCVFLLVELATNASR